MNGKDLKIKLKKLGIELKELAEKLNITPQTLNSRLLADDLKVSFIKDISKAINKSLYSLIEDDSNVDEDVFRNVEEGLSRSEFLLRTDRVLQKNQIIPHYDINAAASFVTLFQKDRSTIIDYFSIPNLPKVDGAISITGDSMYPILKSGDIIFFRKINNTNLIDSLYFGEMYLLDIQNEDDEYTTVKYVQSSERGPEWIKLVSQNQHHSPKDIHLSWVKGAAFVKGSLRINSMS
ncbi:MULTISPECIES: S24 family peptidase [Sphingobacterium]|uniref:S24 family peptidase n=1 Tax=Sphingobacterium TaxID=28453 RepID=UPI00257F6D4D|nr:MULTISPECIES: S24 family peptidase [Sphingobacterium]